MPKGEGLKPFQWRLGESGNPAGRPRKPRRSLDAVQRLESLGVDPLEEAIALARDTSLPKVARLKAWLDLCEFAYPKLSPIASHENVSVRLEELQRSWDSAVLEEFSQAFSAELDTLPEEAKAGLKKLEALGKIGPIIMQALLKFVERRHEQAQAPEEGGLRWSSCEFTIRTAERYMRAAAKRKNDTVSLLPDDSVEVIPATLYLGDFRM